MKIIYLHQYFNTPKMSGGTRSFEMARRLVQKGHEVHVITSWREPTENKEWRTTLESGIQVHWLPVEYSNHLSYVDRVKAFFKFAILASKKAILLGGDVVFATSTPLTIALPGILASKRNRIPMVFEVRDLWPELPIAMGAIKNPIVRYFARSLEKLAYRSSKAIVALSPGMRDGVAKAGYPANNIAIIPNSADMTLFSVPDKLGESFRAQRDWLGARPLLVYAGTFGVINGVGYLVDVATELLCKNPEIRILLVGDGKEYAKVEERARLCGVYGKNLFMEKSIPKEDVPALLNAADMTSVLFIDKPEMRPNSANKFFDALAAAKPVLINYGGWMVHLINDNECGIVTWKMDASEAAERICKAMSDLAWLKMAGRNSKQLAVTQFDREILAEQLERVLKYAISEEESLPRQITSNYYA